MRRRAFTLVELLVVIAVVGVLIGVLLPALSSARATAHSTIGSANLRSLQQGLQAYAITYEHFVPIRMPDGYSHKPTGRYRPRYQWYIGDLIGQPFEPRDDAEHDILQSSADIPRIDNEVFIDPTHTVDDLRDLDGSIRALRNNSYGYNYHYLGNSRTDNPDPEFDNYPVSLNRVKSPSRTISVADSLGNQAKSLQGAREHSYTLDPPRLDMKRNNAQKFAQSDGMSPADARHLGRANAAFIDGHVEALTLGRLGYIVIDEGNNQVQHDAGDNALWNGRGYDKDATSTQP